ncbi:hypothetical protein F8388_017919 [Cannabis sativa]|uniref:Uncharacterized protein n=1 Tax=Cannabis sativa TaxID=3483 RepID=A0A7J6HFP2_CANSA|nr:hypothetical protein G4B88_025073 [Cannabis sativa]KAF4394106.1 hypothetical protein F8388_017919 [Cannabis sativa]
MVSLTPGVLSKLLNNAANKDVRVTGGHRSALLQVIEILPSLSGADDADPWRSRGFFLKVSDSVHSAYASISDQDLDLIYNDEIQLGQFVYVTRLDAASPVPILRGLKPIPKRRPSPCVGKPIDLVPSDLLPLREVGAHFEGSKTKSKITKNDKNVGKSWEKSESKSDIVKPKARNWVTKNGSLEKRMPREGLELRRLSLDSARRSWDQKSACKDDTAHRSVPVPVPRSKSKHVSTSVISDKDTPPKNISTLKCRNLINSPLKNQNNTLSPPLLKKPTKKERKSSFDCITPIRLVNVPLTSKIGSGQKISWDMLPHTIAELGKQALQQRNGAYLAAIRSLEEASATNGVIRCMGCLVFLSPFLFKLLPVVRHGIRLRGEAPWCVCMRIFAELCLSSKKSSAGSLVKNFLDLNQKMQSSANDIDYVVNSRLSGADPSIYFSASNNATSWVKAAVETNLSTFDLFRKQEEDEILKSEKSHYVVLENAQEVNFGSCSPTSRQSRNHTTLTSDLTTKVSQSASRRLPSATRNSITERDELYKGGSKLIEAASLAQKLLFASREWFLKYLEDSLNIGFGMKREEGGTEVASLLGQLKRVNHWLDDIVTKGISKDERIEGLRKKLYGFLLEHVDSTVANNQ